MTGHTHCKVAMLQSCNVAKLQSCNVAKLQSCKVAKMQSCKVAKLQSCKVKTQLGYVRTYVRTYEGTGGLLELLSQLKKRVYDASFKF